MIRIRGVVAPLCTPFAPDGEVNHEALRRNIAKYNSTGLAGYVVAGSTGESALLSTAEKLELYRTAREAAPDKILIAGTGVESVRETVSLAREAAGLRFDAALVITPHYFRGQMLRPESQLTFFRAVADASPLPILIYNFPQMTGIDLAVDVVARLAEHPNIAGLKETSPDLDKVRGLAAALPERFTFVTGASAKFHDALRLGVHGGILGIADAAPRSTQLVFERYQAGDVQGSRDAQQRIVAAAGVAPRYGIQGLKYAMDLKGYFGGPARLPLLPLDAQECAEIEAIFRDVETLD